MRIKFRKCNYKLESGNNVSLQLVTLLFSLATAIKSILWLHSMICTSWRTFREIICFNALEHAIIESISYVIPIQIEPKLNNSAGLFTTMNKVSFYSFSNHQTTTSLLVDSPTVTFPPSITCNFENTNLNRLQLVKYDR